jgi:SlyX protein
MSRVALETAGKAREPSGVSTEERLDRLEERVAWLQRHIAEQDRAMLAMNEQTVRLSRELLALRTRVPNSPLQDEAGGSSPTDDRPPHY